MRYWDGRQWTAQVRAAKRNELAAWRQQVAAARMEMVAAQSTQVAPGDVVAGYPPEQVAQWASRDFTPDGQQLAGWWSRVGAALIDGLIIGVGALLILALFGSVFSVGFFDSEETGIAALVVGLTLSFLAIAIVALLYAPLMMDRTNGKTLGRMAMNIRVVRTSGEPVTFGFALVREVLVKSIFFGIVGAVTFGLAPLLDSLWPLWDEENRALHDLVVNTRVIRT
jgi:uncharacterized RDD family membrane protein YckC